MYAANNPMIIIDPDGNELIFLIRNGDGSVKEQLKYNKGNFWHENGSRYNPGKESVSKTMYKVLSAYRTIEASNDKKLKSELNKLETSKNKHYMEAFSSGTGSGVVDYPKDADAGDKPIGTQTFWDFSSERKDDLKESDGVDFTDLDIVTHEMRHQYDFDTGNMSDNHSSSAIDPAEIRAVNNENRARKIEGNKMRTKYGGKKST